MTPFSAYDAPGKADEPNTEETEQAIGGLRDGLRSARFWHELLTEGERQAMFSDIARVSLLLAGDLWQSRTWRDGDVPAATTAASSAAAPPCPLERLAFLQAAWPRFEAALRQIEAAPPHVLHNGLRRVETEKARRVLPKNVLNAIRSGRDFVPVAASANIALAEQLGGKLPRRVDESMVSPCFDTPANRAVKTVLARFAHDLKTIAALAAANNLTEAAREAERLRNRVRRRLVALPWRFLPLAASLSSDALLFSLLPPSLRSSAPHQRVYQTFRQYAHGFALDWNQPLFSLPAQKTWLLYEIWCVFAVAETLRGLGFAARSGDLLSAAPFGLACRLQTDQASRLMMENPVTHQNVTLFYNRFFGRGAEAGSGGWHSRGRALRPDITLQCSKTGRLLVLDAKFKTYALPGWEGSDIQQMHSYRDAIARGGARNVVGAAWLLYAGKVPSEERRPIIAYPAATLDAPLGNGEVGAICLRPGSSEGCAALVGLLSRFLD